MRANFFRRSIFKSLSEKREIGAGGPDNMRVFVVSDYVMYYSSG